MLPDEVQEQEVGEGPQASGSVGRFGNDEITPPAAVVTEPPQVLVTVPLAITRPAGKVSVKPRFVCGSAPGTLSMVKVSEVDMPEVSAVAPKRFESCGWKE